MVEQSLERNAALAQAYSPEAGEIALYEGGLHLVFHRLERCCVSRRTGAYYDKIIFFHGIIY